MAHGKSTIGTASLFMLLAVSGAVWAGPVTWNNPGTDGDWFVAANWDTGVLPTSADDVYIDSETGHSTTVTYRGSIVSNGAAAYNSLTLSQGDTLVLMPGSGRLGFTNGIFNSGTLAIQNTGSRYIGQNTTGNGTFSIANHGLITTKGTGVQLTMNAEIMNVDNTNGNITATGGATIDLNIGTKTTSSTITGGSLTVADQTSTLTSSNVSTSMILSGVTTSNKGNFLWNHNAGNGTRTKNITVTDGSFTNDTTGTLSLKENGGVNTGSQRQLDFTVNGNNVFTNNGAIVVQNLSADAASKNEYSQLTVNSGASGSFTNNGTITIQNSATGNTAAGYSQYAQMTVSSGSSFVNRGTINVVHDASANQDAAHYAMLSIGSNWTNSGVLIADGANASVSLASGSTTYAYTQTSSGSANVITRLLNNASLKAASVDIASGSLEGSGTVTAATTIESGAHMSAGNQSAGVLTNVGDLTLRDGAMLDFDLDLANSAAGSGGNDLIAVTGNLDLAGQLNINAGANFGIGTYTLMTYTGALTGTGLTLGTTPDEYGYEILADSGSVVLNVTSVPEPAGLALAGFGGLLMLAGRRRRSA